MTFTSQDYEKMSTMSEEDLAPTWSETTEERYWSMMECVPPHKMLDDFFMVGECLTFGVDGAIYHVFGRIGDKFYSRPGYSNFFAPSFYREEIANLQTKEK